MACQTNCLKFNYFFVVSHEDIWNLRQQVRRKRISFSQGKKTLIIIHALENSNKNLKNKILSTLGKSDASLKEIQEIIEAVKNTRSIQYSMDKARDLSIKAKKALSIFPNSKVKNLLLEFNDYLVKRKY